MESDTPSPVEMQPGVEAAAGSPIADGHRTPPCFSLHRKWDFDYGPVLAPDIVRIQDRLTYPKFNSGPCLNSLDFEPCGNKEPFISATNVIQEPTPGIVNPDSKQNQINGHDVPNGKPAQECKFDGSRKRSSIYLYGANDIPLIFRNDSIFGAFKCTKMRKQA
jgi:hypothetical protein